MYSNKNLLSSFSTTTYLWSFALLLAASTIVSLEPSPSDYRDGKEIVLLPPSSKEEIFVKFRILHGQKKPYRLPSFYGPYPPLMTTPLSEHINQTVFSYNTSLSDLKNLPLDPRKKTIFLIHGWLDNIESAQFWWEPIVNSIRSLRPKDYQVIFVDWSRGASSTLYLPAVSNLRVTAETIASTIRTLVDDLHFDPLKIRLIGFSLGAHLAGFTGKLLTGNRQLAWITGLEPANAMFEMSTESGSIFRTDAHYVDIVHSSSGSIFQGFSKGAPLGHRDLYINGAITQPGCEEDMPLGAVGGFLSTRRPCAHDRAPLMFTRARDSSDGSCQVLAWECPSYEDFLIGRCTSCVEEEGDRGTFDPPKSCYRFGFQNDLIHRENWPPEVPDTWIKTHTYYFKANPIKTCLYHYRMIVMAGKSSRPEGKPVRGTLFLGSTFDEDIRIFRDFAPYKNQTMVVGLRKPLDSIKEFSISWDSAGGLVDEIKETILGPWMNGAIFVDKIIFHLMREEESTTKNGKNNRLFFFCGLKGRQEIKSGSRLIMVRC